MNRKVGLSFTTPLLRLSYLVMGIGPERAEGVSMTVNRLYLLDIPAICTVTLTFAVINVVKDPACQGTFSHSIIETERASERARERVRE